MEATVGGTLTGFLRRAGLLVFSRLLFAAVCLLTSLYCLMAFVPFTYIHFLQFEHFGWLAFFVRFHPLLFLGSLALVAATLIEVLGRLRAQRRALLFMLASLVLGVYLVIDPLLGRLQNDSGSLVWSALWMCPLWLLARVDAAACWRGGARWEESLGDGISVRFAAACESAALLTVLNLAVAYARFREVALEAWMAEVASITFHYFVLFMALFAGLELLNGLSARLFVTADVSHGVEVTRALEDGEPRLRMGALGCDDGVVYGGIFKYLRLHHILLNPSAFRPPQRVEGFLFMG